MQTNLAGPRARGRCWTAAEAKLERRRNPTHLYKYRSLGGDARERTRRIIADNALWFSAPTDFNDPFDCSPVLSLQEGEAVTRK